MEEASGRYEPPQAEVEEKRPGCQDGRISQSCRQREGLTKTSCQEKESISVTKQFLPIMNGLTLVI